MKIGIGTLLRDMRGNSTIYLITDETDIHFIVTFVGSPDGEYWLMNKNVEYGNLEVIA